MGCAILVLACAGSNCDNRPISALQQILPSGCEYGCSQRRRLPSPYYGERRPRKKQRRDGGSSKRELSPHDPHAYEKLQSAQAKITEAQKWKKQYDQWVRNGSKGGHFIFNNRAA